MSEAFSSLFINWNPDQQFLGLPFLRWYGILFASSFVFGYFMFVRFFRTEKAPLEWLEGLGVYMAVGTVAGARLGHCFLYDPVYYLSHPHKILMIWEGGLASHGAAVGIILALIFWSRRVSKRSVLWILDRIVIGVALSGLLIRSGNAFNSEILGSETTVPWAFVFQAADQDPEYLKASSDHGKIKLEVGVDNPYGPTALTVMRHAPGQPWVQAGVLEVPRTQGMQQMQFRDTQPDSQRISYFLLKENKYEDFPLQTADSTRKGNVQMGLRGILGDGAQVTGTWTGTQVSLNFRFPKLDRVLPLVLWRSVDGGKSWEEVAGGVLPLAENGAQHAFSDEVPETKQVMYRLLDTDPVLGEVYGRVNFFARHPSMLYEALAYTIIFLFLFLSYFRMQGRVPNGRFFGWFLVLTFSARFIIEHWKEDQEAFTMGLPINMGQLLSVPFVLAGIFFLLRSWRHPQYESFTGTETVDK